MTAVIGTAIFGVESTSEGLALPELASAGQADPGQRADIVIIAGTPLETDGLAHRNLDMIDAGGVICGRMPGGIDTVANRSATTWRA